MENSKENPHPEIETVTPDTDDGQPNDQKHNHRVKNEATDDAEEKPSEADAKPVAESEKQEPVSKEPVEEEKPSEQPDDEADPSDIETVSP